MTAFPPAAAYASLGWYERTASPAPAFPALTGARAAETVIVGGGLAGLALALSLAERGQAPLLLEARGLGSGASGRNGGLVQAGFARSTASLEAALGRPAATALHALSRDAVRLVRERIARHAIPCGPVEGIVTASFFDDPAALRAEAACLNDRHGGRLAFWPRARLRDLYRSPRYFDGLFDPDGFHLDPLALARGYARAAAEAGAALFEDSPALGLTPAGAGWRVTTASGSVTAERVVLCQSAYPPPLKAEFARAVLPVFTFIMVTEPLGERAATAIRAPHAVYDDRFATGYYRLLPDGRLLWGGRIDLRERPRQLEALLRRDLAFVYPQLAGVEVAHSWSGRMGFTRHKMPIVGEAAPGLWLTTGFGGHGLNTTTMAGEAVAAAIAAGDDRHRLFAPFAPVPVFGALGRLAAQGLWWGQGVREGWRARAHRRREQV